MNDKPEFAPETTEGQVEYVPEPPGGQVEYVPEPVKIVFGPVVSDVAPAGVMPRGKTTGIPPAGEKPPGMP
jgi:hypothetical protein